MDCSLKNGPISIFMYIIYASAEDKLEQLLSIGVQVKKINTKCIKISKYGVVNIMHKDY